jgi:hypothetical protein
MRWTGAFLVSVFFIANFTAFQGFWLCVNSLLSCPTLGLQSDKLHLDRDYRVTHFHLCFV